MARGGGAKSAARSLKAGEGGHGGGATPCSRVRFSCRRGGREAEAQLGLVAGGAKAPVPLLLRTATRVPGGCGTE